MLEAAERYIKTHIKRGTRVGIAVSGGKDSMCLLRFILDKDLIEKRNIVVVNINHNIRKEADEESKFVKEFCAANGVAFTLFCVDVPARSAASGRSVEYEGRCARYGIFNELKSNGAVDCVLTAHHALDQAESILMHIARGCGLDGLCGMRESGQVLRPFLNVYPVEIDGYVKEKDIKYLQDNSNFDISYDRNFIRHQILKPLQSRYGGAVKSLVSLSEEAYNAVCFLDSQLDESLVRTEDDHVFLSLDALNSAICDRYILKALSAAGIEQDVSRAHIRAIKDLAGSRNGAGTDIAGGFRAQREYTDIVFFKQTEKSGQVSRFVLGENKLKNIRVTAKIDNGAKIIKGLTLDYDKLPEGCVLRFRREGDIFKPYNGGTKKLKEYLIDKKIPKRIRDSLPLLCYNDTVLCVIGKEISDTVKIGDGTKNVLTLFVTLK